MYRVILFGRSCSSRMFLYTTGNIAGLDFNHFQVMDEIQKHGIRLYDFPECDQDEDEDFRNLTKQLKVLSLV